MANAFGENDGAEPGCKGGSYMGVCKVREKYRRIDIKAYPGCQEAFATMYFTGGAHFNRSMRSFCKRAGLTLSDAGLALARRGEGGKKVEVRKSVSCDSEEEIMEAIGLKYVRPEFREINEGGGEVGDYWGGREWEGGDEDEEEGW